MVQAAGRGRHQAGLAPRRGVARRQQQRRQRARTSGRGHLRRGLRCSWWAGPFAGPCRVGGQHGACAVSCGCRRGSGRRHEAAAAARALGPAAPSGLAATISSEACGIARARGPAGLLKGAQGRARCRCCRCWGRPARAGLACVHCRHQHAVLGVPGLRSPAVSELPASRARPGLPGPITHASSFWMRLDAILLRCWASPGRSSRRWLSRPGGCWLPGAGGGLAAMRGGRDCEMGRPGACWRAGARAAGPAGPMRQPGEPSRPRSNRSTPTYRAGRRVRARLCGARPSGLLCLPGGLLCSGGLGRGPPRRQQARAPQVGCAASLPPPPLPASPRRLQALAMLARAGAASPWAYYAKLVAVCFTVGGRVGECCCRLTR